MKVSVYDILQSRNAIFHEDGLCVFEQILSAVEAGADEVEVSFKDIKVCTTQFLNACFGKLLLKYGEDTVQKIIHPDSYNEINAFKEKYDLVWDNFKEKNQAFLEEAYA